MESGAHETNDRYQTPGERLAYITDNWNSIIETEGRMEAGRLFSEATRDCHMLDAYRTERNRRMQLVINQCAMQKAQLLNYFDNGSLYLEALDGSYDEWLTSKTSKLEQFAQREWLKSTVPQTPGVSPAMKFPDAEEKSENEKKFT